MMKMNRMTVEQCADMMQVSPQFVRIGLQKGVLPFGYAVKMSGRWTYFISRQKFIEHTGIEV
jgi:hypothetical protein